MPFAIDGFMVFTTANSFHGLSDRQMAAEGQDFPPPESLAIWLELLLAAGIAGMDPAEPAGYVLASPTGIQELK